MTCASRNRAYEKLVREVQGEEYQELLLRLRKKETFFRQFQSWLDVIGFMRSGISRDPRKDALLRPILRAHRGDGDRRWRTILLTIFWPGLESIHWQKRGWDRDEKELWQNIVWTFLQIIGPIDVNRRPDRLVQKLYNDTVHHLHDKYRLAWRQTDGEILATADEIDSLSGGVPGLDLSGLEIREAQELEIKRLREHLADERITEADFLLLVGTRVYGKSVADYARERGLNYQAIKKRRQRIEAVIRKSEHESKKI